MSIELKVPSVGESISEVEIGQWLKKEGDSIQDGETIAVLESEKATVDLPAPTSGVLTKILKTQGETAAVGDVIAHIDETSAKPSKKATAGDSKDSSDSKDSKESAEKPQAASKKEEPADSEPESTSPSPKVMPAAARVLAEAGISAADVTPSGPGDRILKEDALKAVAALDEQTSGSSSSNKAPSDKEPKPSSDQPTRSSLRTTSERDSTASSSSDRTEESVRMSKLRRTVAARLVAAKQDMALLTTFNEIDMSTVMTLRKEIQESFQQRHGVKLGFMSFFVKAVIDALKVVPQLNAEIRDDQIVFKSYYDIGVAIGGGKGLVVPVLRNAERIGFAQIEKAISDFAVRAKDGKLKPDELNGGTFTISNGGVYGSLLSTPIVSPPQSGVLGMHTIQERPVAIQGQVQIRPMMYVALTYDHRIVDGREAVIFLKRIKDVIENPARILLEA
jgi:2-oxoglutarate dehydrogenase E2 component (dihydrolipoamide succinyltransferase)